jgi:hypothetical protein
MNLEFLANAILGQAAKLPSLWQIADAPAAWPSSNFFYHWLGRALGLDEMQDISDHKFSFASGGAQRAPMLMLLGLVALVAVAGLFYFRHQSKGHRGWRIALFVIRAAVLCQVLLLLAEPILTLTIESRKRPALWVLFDGTDSMNIADDLPPDVRKATDKAVGMEEADAGAASKSPGDAGPSSAVSRHSRVEYLRALVQKKDQNLLELLGKEFRLQAFLFETTGSVRTVELTNGLGPYDGKRVAEQLTANGQVTDIGGAINDLAQRSPSSSLAGLVVFSDFQNTSGPRPASAARQFGAKIYTVGVGATQAAQVTATIVAVPCAKMNDEVPVTVVLEPSRLNGQSTRVRLYAELLSGGGRTLVGEKESPPLSNSKQLVEFTFKPTKAGRTDLVAEIDRLPGEAVQEKNRADREIKVIDDYLRLMYVEFEPNWEWRFMKEVFHRDPLVGMKGFRTFLYSSDPQVRQPNSLFLASMTPPREEFFKNDLIFLGDMPSGPPNPALSDRFCKLVKEFVGEKGGGLVVLSGRSFGPQQLAKTSLADLLPVTIDPRSKVRDEEPFELKLTVPAAEYPFMQLGAGSSLEAMQKAWDNLGPLPWYQPVENIHPSATVLAEHPTAKCGNGKKQPLIVIRPYGLGEVVYVAFDETWRLRRAHGEELYRKFWSELMWRLAMNHALGADKRFILETDKQRYRVDETATLKVRASDAQYKPLSEKEIPSGKLSGQWTLPAAHGRAPVAQPLSLTQVEPGLFTTRFVVTAPGEHSVSVIDPITQKAVKWSFSAYSATGERKRPVRDKDLQEAIATASDGRHVDLSEVQSLLETIQPTLRTETSITVVSLVNTWACFGVIAGLLLAEWILRKRIGLP